MRLTLGKWTSYGDRHLLAAMSFAVGCGLHQMSSDMSGRSVPGNVLLPPPQNLADYLERVNVFSNVFQVRVVSYVPHHIFDRYLHPVDRTTSLSRKWSSLNAR